MVPVSSGSKIIAPTLSTPIQAMVIMNLKPAFNMGLEENMRQGSSRSTTCLSQGTKLLVHANLNFPFFPLLEKDDDLLGRTTSSPVRAT